MHKMIFLGAFCGKAAIYEIHYMRNLYPNCHLKVRVSFDGLGYGFHLFCILSKLTRYTEIICVWSRDANVYLFADGNKVVT